MLFDSRWVDFQGKNKWIQNPVTLDKYPMHHWSKINQMNPELGDIKLIWEASKFKIIQEIISFDSIYPDDRHFHFLKRKFSHG